MTRFYNGGGIAGPQGAEGPQGPQGIQGQQGTQGEVGAALTILGSYPDLATFNAAALTGSAGDAWLLLSDGSLMVWNTDTLIWFDAGDLQGPQGQQGIQGESGDQGIQGTQGIQGIQGIQGVKGDKGDKGETGSSGLLTARVGSFFDTTIQTATLLNTAYAMTFNTIDISQGVSLVSGSQLTVDTTGIYNIQFSAQVRFLSGGGSGEVIQIWLRKNGTDVPESAGKIVVQTSVRYSIISWNYFVQLNAGQNVQLMWSTDNNRITLFNNTALPPAPGIPSVIVTMNQISA